MTKHTQTLFQTISQLTVKPKGIFAADESIKSLGKKFASHAIENTEKKRRAYRDMLLSTPKLNEFISGVILYEETMQHYIQEALCPRYLESIGIIPGIKLDLGLEKFNNEDEELTQGIETLEERCEFYFERGARFAKWRGVFKISSRTPSPLFVKKNANLLGQYAKICQNTGLVPIVEPEVLADGIHSIDSCYEHTVTVLRDVFDALKENDVDLSLLILKPNMIIPGLQSIEAFDHNQIAEMTYNCLRENVPHTVPAIMFLSGGQSDQDATINLDKIVRLNQLPWRISFSYGRALQDQALETWQGKEENVASAQKYVLMNIKNNSLASMGLLP